MQMAIETSATTTDFSEFLIQWMTKFEQSGEYCFYKTRPKTAFLRMIFSLINDNTFEEIISFLLWVLCLHKQYFHHKLKIIFLLKITQPLQFRLCLIVFFSPTCICKPMQQNSAVPFFLGKIKTLSSDDVTSGRELYSLYQLFAV